MQRFEVPNIGTSSCVIAWHIKKMKRRTKTGKTDLRNQMRSVWDPNNKDGNHAQRLNTRPFDGLLHVIYARNKQHNAGIGTNQSK